MAADIALEIICREIFIIFVSAKSTRVDLMYLQSIRLLFSASYIFCYSSPSLLSKGLGSIMKKVQQKNETGAIARNKDC